MGTIRPHMGEGFRQMLQHHCNLKVALSKMALTAWHVARPCPDDKQRGQRRPAAQHACAGWHRPVWATLPVTEAMLVQASALRMGVGPESDADRAVRRLNAEAGIWAGLPCVRRRMEPASKACKTR